MSNYSPGIPSSFDPAIFLHSEADFPQDAPTSDDFDALQQCVAEDKARKIKDRVVIQHRAWNFAEVFRSEEDYPIDTPPKHQKCSKPRRFPTGSSTDGRAFPSSPPSIAMPLISSPVTYPPSSMLQPTSPKKRKRSDDERSPLKDVQANPPARNVGGFLDDSDDEEETEILMQQAMKRRAMNSIKDLAVSENTGYTPPASQEEVLDPEAIPVGDLDNYDFKSPSPQKPTQAPSIESTSAQPKYGVHAKLASGKTCYVPKKITLAPVSFESLVASRSVAVEGKARKSYYGIDIHHLIDEARNQDEEKAQEKEQAIRETIQPSVEETVAPAGKSGKSSRTLMWTEKYRARKFTDLCGDERTHRSVLRWLKGWEPIVFPGSSKAKLKIAKKNNDDEDHKHRKILLLTGPPGLGKTTLAHVCARQAGYEVQEINASDERSHTVVKGRIRDMVGTENVRGITTSTANGKVRKAGKPVCVVVDEVDGVVGGSGGSGEGGFVKALIDLINLDEKNSKLAGVHSTTTTKKRKGDKFRLLRPLILICNDVYHPSLRPLRQSSLAEIVHIRKPAMGMVVSRIHDIFVKEGIQCDTDGVRRLCEATWGVSNKKEGGNGSGTGEGDIRGVMVVSEWVAGRIRAAKRPADEKPHLTRQWIEEHVLTDLHHGGGAARSLGRGGARDVVDRVFREGAGFPRQSQAEKTDPWTSRQGKLGVIGVAETAKRRAMERLREMVDTSGDTDRIISDCFTAYPEKPFQDDTLLSKPNAAHEWLHFHDALSSAIHGGQEWELFPYLSQSVLAFHDLFASPRHQSSNPMVDPDAQPTPFSGPGANYQAFEQLKANRATLMGLQSTLSLPLTRMFRSTNELAIELLPYVLRMLSPDVKPVLVNTGSTAARTAATASVRKASEKLLVKKAVEAMTATGVRFEKSRVDIEDVANRSGGWVLRMEPPLDALSAFETLSIKRDDKVRFAVRSVLEAEHKRETMRLDVENRKRRGGRTGDDEMEDVAEDEGKGKKIDLAKKVAKRDFFGRIIKEEIVPAGQRAKGWTKADTRNDEGRIWVTFHEGFSNAVRKPVTLDDFMRGL
ncbi:hypothetical protein K504DRAFT_398522 [Pleomassaria siparia CBS 279.74]|uniref:AAA+ ATPase domain-containing protein n=1 Tax=Pleomassaria siparia CBS 279.74 TaxID=1314801 RepID=A0A6G1KKQ7_9PLEO|nr:hypothetical protein K504DRAFT_398522 [Pleomassaria siparia CBS 279.74]